MISMARLANQLRLDDLVVCARIWRALSLLHLHDFARVKLLWWA